MVLVVGKGVVAKWGAEDEVLIRLRRTARAVFAKEPAR